MFYKLKVNTGPEGNFGLRDRMPSGYNVFAENSQGNLKLDCFPGFEPKFADLMLTKESTEVDFIEDMGGIGGYGVMVSKRAKEVLETFNLGQHCFYSIGFIDKSGKKELGKYYWLQILVKNYPSWIDYQKSTFFKSDIFLESKKQVKINSIEGFLKTVEELDYVNENIGFESLVFEEEFSKNPIDFFYLRKLSMLPFCSEELYKNILEESLTGIETFIDMKGKMMLNF